MRRARALAVLVAASAFAGGEAAADEGVDVLRYDLDVALRGKDLAVATTIRAAGRPPAKWSLELVPEMRVLSAESGGKPVPFAAEGRGVTLDLSGVPAAAGGEFSVSLRLEGSPREEWTSKGFVRSAVRPEVAHIRSQHPWYPRVPDDPALYRTVVDAPEGWQVRTAGGSGPPVAKGGRATWTFETPGPVDRAGLAAGPWRVRSLAGSGGTVFDALVTEAHEKSAGPLLEAAKEAFGFYTKRFGAVERARISLVEMPPEFGVGSGYGEDGYILLGPGAFEAGEGSVWLPGGIAHEVAHAWWGGDVHFSNFAGESLAEYSTLLFLGAARGEDAARGMRKAAVERWAEAASAGKEAALADIGGFGGDMDSGTYRVHAYEKAMMVLAMVERAAGDGPEAKLLARFFEENRGRRVGWKDLRAALAEAGPAARTILEQWERPGIPTLAIESESKKAGGGWTVTGRLKQSGTPKPFRMTVTVAALCGGKRVEAAVKLDGAEAAFTLKAPSEPEAVSVDPDFLVLAARGTAGAVDAKKDLEEAGAVANDQTEADPKKLQDAMARLRALLKAEAVSGGEEALCHTFIAHCLFRLGRTEEAADEYGTALRLGAGGPFHRGWVHFRLGNIADLRGKRKDALEHYNAVIESKGSSSTAVGRARKCLEKPYRGYKADG